MATKKRSGSGASVIPIVLLAAGAIMLYAAIKDLSPIDAVKAVVGGPEFKAAAQANTAKVVKNFNDGKPILDKPIDKAGHGDPITMEHMTTNPIGASHA